MYKRDLSLFSFIITKIVFTINDPSMAAAQPAKSCKNACGRANFYCCNLRAATINMSSSTGVFSLFCRLGVVYLIFRVLPREGWLMIFG